MTKILNLNQLSAKESREVQIGETTYTIKEMSVEDFIETTRVAEAMQDEPSYAKQLQETVKLIVRSIPDVPSELLMRLSLDQLRGLTAFIRGEDPASIIAAQQASAEGGATEAGNA